jgi:hypothetical protein
LSLHGQQRVIVMQAATAAAHATRMRSLLSITSARRISPSRHLHQILVPASHTHVGDRRAHHARKTPKTHDNAAQRIAIDT